jgi:hypothetical protein
MRKLFAFSFLLLGAGMAQAQQTVNDPNAQVRNVGSFTSISVSSGVDLYLSPGETETVVVSASEEKYRDKIMTVVENGTLKIYYDWKSNIQINWGSNKKLKAYVSFKTLQKLSASGGSDVSATTGVIKQPSLELSLSGGSDFQGRVETDQLKVSQSGGSDSDIRGSATKATINISGGSDMDGYELKVNDCTVNASGGSDISITVSGNFTANASGGSDISYKGDCALTKNSSGGSSVRKRG